MLFPDIGVGFLVGSEGVDQTPPEKGVSLGIGKSHVHVTTCENGLVEFTGPGSPPVGVPDFVVPLGPGGFGHPKPLSWKMLLPDLSDSPGIFPENFQASVRALLVTVVHVIGDQIDLFASNGGEKPFQFTSLYPT